jgi:hypothetical protein
MRIDLRNLQREPLFSVDVDLTAPPTLVQPPDDEAGHTERGIALDWDRAIDDEGHLRRCPVCGCPDLHRRKSLPRITAFVIVVVAAIAAMALAGIAEYAAALVVLLVLGSVDLAIYWLAQPMLVCYRCHSSFTGAPPGRHHEPWNRETAAQYEAPEPTEGETAPETDG